jgi:(1->4)-alpha-D-glucan 1-alpha-D-glucosylmutase
VSDQRPRYLPASTYRLQLHREFPFAAARKVVAYLAELGVSACYTAPYFTASPESTHGYDVCNHNEVSPELGGAAEHAAFIDALQAKGLGHVVDFVPNHMGIGTNSNLWWKDVLENGPSSPSAGFFDIEWAPVKTELHAKLLLPILGDQYGKVLERGELQLAFHDGQLVLNYFEHELPINPRQSPRVFRRAVKPLTDLLGQDDSNLHELLSIIAALENMPPYTARDADQVAERQREKEVARKRLLRLVDDAPMVGEQLNAAMREVNGEPGRGESFDALHELLEAQPYRLSYWRTASHEINYRRFFDINTLAGLRVERPEVFAATHRLLSELIASGRVQGVRIDHPDGLFDPARYFDMLQDLAAQVWEVRRNSNGGRPDRPLYVVAEKIVSGRERLPSRWAVHGTTGYNFLNELNGLFVSSAQARRMRRAYAKLTGRTEAFDDVLYASKRLIMETAMASELSVLAHMLDRTGESNRNSRDFTLESLRDAITEVVACFPVYRTYVDEHGWTADDRAVVVQAVSRARRRNPAMEASLFDFLLEVVLPRMAGEPLGRAAERRGGYPAADANEARERLRFAMKLQQYTGPVQAKGLEDTAFYRYNLLLSLNEVGGDPSRVGRGVDEFHHAALQRRHEWPFEMVATSTHDTKLGEDVRARINVLSEIPDEWARDVSRWIRLNRSHRSMVDGEPAPDRNDEYRFYQGVVGTWPAGSGTEGASADYIDRIKGFMIKSVKEAKLHTSWITPNIDYENAVVRFVERVLSGAGGARFVPAMLPLQRRIAALGALNSLAQVVLKIASPGVPDFYQGTEVWDLNLVDPDNRRPVNFEIRATLLAEVDAMLRRPVEERVSAIASLLNSWPDARIKLLVTAAGLRLRREHEALFMEGEYVPLVTEVTVNADIVAFARVHGEDAVIVAAPRLMAPLVGADLAPPLGGAGWKTSRVILPPALADRTFRHEITGAEIRPTSAGGQAWIFAGELFETVPVALAQAVTISDR